MIFILPGKYTNEGLETASKERTKKSVKIIEKNNGKLNSIYALLGNYDIILNVEFPDVKNAMQASIELTKLTNISFSSMPAIPVEELDNLIG